MTKKMRIYELADELHRTSKEIIEIAIDAGVKVETHQNTVTAEEQNLIRAAARRMDFGEELGEILRYDDRTGRGKILLTSSSKELDFDLRQTRLSSKRFRHLLKGMSVTAAVSKDVVERLTLD